MFEVKLYKTARKSLKKLNATIQKRIIKALIGLASEPTPNGCKKLKGQNNDVYRIRIGDYRVIYRINNGELIILVVSIGHRREIYRNY